MMRLNVYAPVLALLWLVSSCNKKELPVPAHNAGDVLTASVNLEPTYKWQVYYSLKSNAPVSQCLKTSWDLGFEASAAGYRVVLNTAKSMFAMSTGKTDMTLVTAADTGGFSAHKKWDAPGGSLDSTAIGDWRAQSPVYIIDRGYNDLGQSMGIEKVQVVLVNDSMYEVRIAALSAATSTTVRVKKDSAYNLSFLSFDSSGRQVSVEPPKADWDLAFTQYTHIFYDPVMPYLVTGCLLNRNNTAAYMDTAVAFKQMTYASVHSERLSDEINAIGYDWKAYNGTKYTTNPALTYVVKDGAGILYKLHFVDFYSMSGVKGSPKWEYQRL